MNRINTSVIVPIIDLFNMCPVNQDELQSAETVKDFIKKGLLKGYVINPSCDEKYIHAWINSVDIQYNSTFYKTWNDITNKSRFELFVDQVLHYWSTYGTNFEGDTYVPNINPEEPAWDTYKVINSCTYKDLYDKCINMINSGIALKSDTVRYVTDYIINYSIIYNEPIDVDAIRNREAMTIICKSLNILPKDGAKLFAYIVYVTTGETMIVNNREMRNLIKKVTFSWRSAEVLNIWKLLNEDQLIALSSVFNRYKELFIAYKSKSAHTVSIINKIGRLSKKHHKPMQRGYWETVLSRNPLEVMSTIEKEAAKATNYKLISVMQSIRERLLIAAGEGDHLFIIRNGKVYTKESEYLALDSRYYHWEDVYEVCKKQLIKNLSNKREALDNPIIKLPESYHLSCPTSEKNFVGNIPFGSYCDLGNHAIMGIYWKESWGANDLDLSYENINGERIGWNSSYNKDGVVYSGDLTSAPNGANELLYIENNAPAGIVYVNKYSGDFMTKFKMFFGNDAKFVNCNNMNCTGAMVNPNKITLESDVVQNNTSQSIIGVVYNNRIHFMDLACGYNRVATSFMHKSRVKHNTTISSADVNKAIVQMLMRKVNSTISIEEVLVDAGFTIYDKSKHSKYDVDFTELDRSKLIEFFG